MRLEVVLEGKGWEQKVRFMCSSFAFSKIYCLVYTEHLVGL